MRIGLIGYGWLAKNFSKYLNDHHPKCELLLTRRHSFELETTFLPNITYVTAPLVIEDHQVHCSPDLLTNLDKLFCFINPDDNYAAKVKSLVQQTEEHTNLILVTSTGIFTRPGNYKEASTITADTSRSQQLYIAEQEVLKKQAGQVLRSAGQIGEGRFPAKSISKKDDFSLEDGVANIIHSDDLVRILALFVNSEIQAKIVHAVSPFHPLKSEYYKAQAQNLGLSLPKFRPSQSEKVIDSEVLESLKYTWLNPKCI